MILIRTEMKSKPEYVSALEKAHEMFGRLTKAKTAKLPEALKEVADAYEFAARRVIDLSFDLNKSAEIASYFRTCGGSIQTLGLAAQGFGWLCGKPGLAKLGHGALSVGRALSVGAALTDLVNLIIKDVELQKRYDALKAVIARHSEVKQIYPQLHDDFETFKALVEAIEADTELSDLNIGTTLNSPDAELVIQRYGCNVAYIAVEAKAAYENMVEFRNFSNELNCGHGLTVKGVFSKSVETILAVADIGSGVMGILKAQEQQASLENQLQQVEEQKKYIHKQADDINTSIDKLTEGMRKLEVNRIAAEYGVQELSAEQAKKFEEKLEELRRQRGSGSS